jgi:hypothetical protein
VGAARSGEHHSGPGDPDEYKRAELDSHADTCVFGSGVKVLADTGRRIVVSGFNDKVGSNGVPVVTLAVAYDCPRTGETYLLVFHEALHIPEMTVHLLNPNQIRGQGIEVNDVPLQLLPEDSRIPRMHSIISKDPPMHIPLSMKGVCSGFTVREPTWDECRDVDQEKVTIVQMTSVAPWEPGSWDPSDIEGTLRASLSEGHQQVLPELELRDLSQLQVRGQSLGGGGEFVSAAVPGGVGVGGVGVSVDDGANGGASVGVSGDGANPQSS